MKEEQEHAVDVDDKTEHGKSLKLFRLAFIDYNHKVDMNTFFDAA